MTAEAAALPLPLPRTDRARRTAMHLAVGALAVTVLVLGGVALRTAAAADDDSTMTVAQLDDSLGIRANGSRELDQAPVAVLQAALDREVGDAARLAASGAAVGSEQHLGVAFTTTSRAGAERLVLLLQRTTRFTVALSAPTAGQPRWTVGGITPAAPVTVPIAHQLTERMSEAAWRAGGATFSGWRVLGE